MFSYEILHCRYKGKATLHHHPVFYYRSEYIIHIHYRFEHTTGIYRSRQIKKYKVIFPFKPAGYFGSLFRSGSDYRICFSGIVLKLTAKQTLVIFALFKILKITAPKILKTELGIITVNNCHIYTSHIIKITGKQHCYGGLADASFLITEGDKNRTFVHILLLFG